MGNLSRSSTAAIAPPGVLEPWANLTKTEVVGNIKIPEQLEGQEETMFNREEFSRLESGQPDHKVIFYAIYSNSKFNAQLNINRYGSVKYVHPTNPEQDQVFSAKTLTGMALSYRFFLDKIKLTIGGDNIFDVYPDKHTNPTNINSGRFIYSRRVTQFGTMGAYYYFKVDVNF